jgi:hypothetical protein
LSRCGAVPASLVRDYLQLLHFCLSYSNVSTLLCVTVCFSPKEDPAQWTFWTCIACASQASEPPVEIIGATAIAVEGALAQQR